MINENSQVEYPKYGLTTSQDINYKIWKRLDKLYKFMLSNSGSNTNVPVLQEITTGWVTDDNGDNFWLETIVDPVTGVISYNYYDSPGGTVGTPQMPVTAFTNGVTSKVREELGYEILSFTDSSVLTLTSPVNANLAEIQVQGGTIQYMFGVDPTAAGIWVGSGQRIEAESLDEINKLQIIGASGNSGTLIIHYFCVNTPDGNN